jgi:hypothetical protein
MRATRVTYIDRRGLRARARQLVNEAIARFMLALAILGHVIVLLAGALDALVTSLVGIPRISYGTRKFVEVVRETWKEEL